MKEIVIRTLTDEEIVELQEQAIIKALSSLSRSEEPKYYSPDELGWHIKKDGTKVPGLFPFANTAFRTWIKNGHFGKSTRYGRFMATYKEAEKFLTERK